MIILKILGDVLETYANENNLQEESKKTYVKYLI